MQVTATNPATLQQYQTDISQARLALSATINGIPLWEVVLGPSFRDEYSSVKHSDYSVHYFRDSSILIIAKHSDAPIVLDDERTYYRDTVEHAARCMGLFSKDARAKMIGHERKWVDGVHWSNTGSLIDVA